MHIEVRIYALSEYFYNGDYTFRLFRLYPAFKSFIPSSESLRRSIW